MRFPTLLILLIIDGKPIYRQDLHSFGNAAGCHTLSLLCLLVRLKVTKLAKFPHWQPID